MLHVRNLRAGYGDRIVLDGITLSIAAGERICLIGHNGAGKSTIMKSITGQIRPAGGEIHFAGGRVDGMAPETLVRLGIVQVPAGRRVFPQLTVRQNLEAGAFVRRDKAGVAADMDRMMRQFPVLSSKAGMRAGVLSGGEQQMLAIARGLMARPRLLLVDEPSLGLSPVMVDEVFDFLAGLAGGDMILVLAEQNVRKALAATDRAIVLSQGAIVAQMASAQLLSDTEFRRAYLGAE
ncbi:ABC transporter ATP-binding protein [Labrys monachus]|uniref:Branched-chain amino acid transport system ATP-binding protein n=1 Tax=Labrys monachus TaxID=217067 RepID=A0ABU0F8T9_9HYPH|nr:ABC transporter ATP-binding protein [Labrys monachus]MDQ0390498.1 branched-chain amino acid transport system ATP-binding protein [Labrys monachus]